MRLLRRLGRAPKIVLSSSIQAELDNPYGVSKRQAEEVLRRSPRQTGAPVSIYRLKNVFGKWCRPNYNSVVATFCHNIAHDLPIPISDPGRELELVYVDDVVARVRWRSCTMPAGRQSACAPTPIPSYTDHAGRSGRADSGRSARCSASSVVPDFCDPLQPAALRDVSVLPRAEDRWHTAWTSRRDDRGQPGRVRQVAVTSARSSSRGRSPGITRGNHYHHTKTEKFLVVAGEGVIRFRHIEGDEVIEYRVRGEDFRVVDIPPGYTHSIENVGDGEMVTLFWASEVFDPDRPDTYFLPCRRPAEQLDGQTA